MADYPTLAFIGAGRLACITAPALAALGYPVEAIASRSWESAERAAALVPGAQATTVQGAVDAAHVVFVTTTDGAIAEVAKAAAWREGQFVVHCSGALSLEPLEPARAAQAQVGSWHPFQTFGGSVELTGVTFGIEAEGELLELLERMAHEVGGYPLRVPAHARALYHAASVMSCGYLTTLLSVAQTLWADAGLPPEDAMRAIGHLARSTIANIETIGAPSALTGPTSRGDAGTVRLHLDALKNADPDLLPFYREVSLRSVELARIAGRPGAALDWASLFDEYDDGGH